MKFTVGHTNTYTQGKSPEFYLILNQKTHKGVVERPCGVIQMLPLVLCGGAGRPPGMAESGHVVFTVQADPPQEAIHDKAHFRARSRAKNRAFASVKQYRMWDGGI